MQAIDSATITLKVKFTDGSNTLVTRKVVEESAEVAMKKLRAAMGMAV